MTSGLVQIVSYGSEDLYLTGNPEITYFKTVYRRYTNFAMENVEVQFDDEVNFDRTSIVSLPTSGDLIHKVYLKLVIPSFYVTREIDPVAKAAAYANYVSTLSEYATCWTFMYVNMQAYRLAYEVYSASNITSYEPIQAAVFQTFGNASRNVGYTPNSGNNSEDENVRATNDFYTLVGNFSGYSVDTMSMDVIAYSFVYNSPDPEGKSSKERIFSSLRIGMLNSQRFLQTVYNYHQAAYNTYQEFLLTNRKFAWVDYLGHSIINYIEVSIGGDVIDKHYGDWINIWYELTKNVHMENIYNKMIGNVSTLTTYDRTTKPSYTLLIPLQFWFCRNNGMAIPIVSMQFMNVSLNLKLKKFSECSYIELADGESSFNLDDEYEDQDLSINGSLLIDYIYLDLQERKKFAQSSHEYLIEQLQIFSEEDISSQDYQFDISFNNPCEELIWVLQRKSFITNSTGATKCLWNNYTYSSSGEGISITSAHVELNGINIIEDMPGEFFNYLIPYKVHTSSPTDGIYVYTFALKPEEHQPSGSCNLSRIKKANLIVVIKNSMFTSGDTVNFRTYARSYNILRFASGMAGLAFV